MIGGTSNPKAEANAILQAKSRHIIIATPGRFLANLKEGSIFTRKSTSSEYLIINKNK